MRTIEEIAERAARSDDIFGHDIDILVRYLPFDKARPFLSAGAVQREPHPLDLEAIRGEMKEYLEFAWEKAEGHRGLSALRSITRMRAWLWLLKDEELLRFADDQGWNWIKYTHVIRSLNETPNAK
jgi:hypothetical protein